LVPLKAPAMTLRRDKGVDNLLLGRLDLLEESLRGVRPLFLGVEGPVTMISGIFELVVELADRLRLVLELVLLFRPGVGGPGLE